MAILAVLSNGDYVDLATPSSYVCLPMEISEADRTVEGDMVKDRIAVKRQITVMWKGVTNAQKNTIASLTGANSCQLKYYDHETSTVMYGTFYRGNDYKLQPLDSTYTGAGWSMYAITMSLTEL